MEFLHKHEHVSSLCGIKEELANKTAVVFRFCCVSVQTCTHTFKHDIYLVFEDVKLEPFHDLMSYKLQLVLHSEGWMYLAVRVTGM